jgi:antitoxin YefM
MSFCTVFLYSIGASMAIRTTYTQARANLAEFCDEVTENREVVIISRRGTEDVALVSASELAGLTETAHLLRSPKNADRLLRALERAKAETGEPQTVEELRRELGLASDQ